MTAVEEIKQHVDRLQALLAKPQEGLMSWTTMCGREFSWLANYWKGGIKYANEVQKTSPL